MSIKYIILVLIIASLQIKTEEAYISTEQRRYTAIDTTGYNYFPSVSPDGKYVAYIKRVENDFFTDGDIWLYDVENQSRKLILGGGKHFSGYDGYISWGKNSKELFFLIDADIVRYNIMSGEQTKVIDNGPMTLDNIYAAPSISPLEKTIAYFKLNDKYHSVFLFDVDRKQVKEIPLGDEAYGESYFYNPQWTPDGKYLIVSSHYTEYQSVDKIGTRLVKINVATQEIEEIAGSTYSEFFQVTANHVYYTRYNREYKNGYLIQYDFITKQKKVVNENQYEVFALDSHENIYFSRKDSLFRIKDGVSSYLFQGINPVVRANKLVYEEFVKHPDINEKYLYIAEIDP